jgi:hypothetical protein
MADHNVVPPEEEIKHLLGTVHFLKTYLKQAAVWPFICAVANLEPAAVSINSSVFYIFQIQLTLFPQDSF